MLDAGFFRGVGKSFADGNLVSPMRCVDEGALRTFEQIVKKFAVFQGADVYGDVGQLRQFFCDKPVQLFHLRSDLPA